jgi:hypothetical protein
MQSASSPRIATARRAIRAYIQALNCLYKKEKVNDKTGNAPGDGLEVDAG